MKNLVLTGLILIAFSNIVSAQNYYTKNGKISFFSKTDIENIEAVNNQVVSVLNTKSGETKFSVVIKGFVFKKALMQEHFNENYMESNKFPKSSFSGTVTDINKVDFSKDGDYKVSVTGNLMIHGVTKKITTPATIAVKAGKISANTNFNILIADYGISIPKLVQGNISKSIEIKVDCNYEPR